jgi:hypothetical protein
MVLPLILLNVWVGGPAVWLAPCLEVFMHSDNTSGACSALGPSAIVLHDMETMSHWYVRVCLLSSTVLQQYNACHS